MLHARRSGHQFLFDDKMTQMTQSRLFPRAPDLRFLGHLGHLKNNDPNDPMATSHWRQLAIKNNDPNDPNDPRARGRSAGWRHGQLHSAGRPAPGRADGKGPAKTYGP